MERKHKFNSLTPEVLPENKAVYTEALDFAFSNNDIKNIAITGIYGAGKSSVWKTYEEKEKLKNVVTVSLGKYEDNLSDETPENPEQGEDGVKLEGHQQGKDYSDSENRLEKQLINQILSQIPVEQIPLSKYRFKQNKNKYQLFSQVFMTIIFLISIIFWMLKDDVILNKVVLEAFGDTASTWILFGSIIGFIIPLSYFLYGFYKENKIRLSRINLKGAEANLKDDDDKDESILDRDIKEIVYALSYSNTNIVVFEDLDRYENITIFTKLRELNFLVNSHLKIKNDDRVVRFVYMLRDGLFVSKNRTKFFDFVLPIVPIIDSKNSENKLIELFNGMKNTPSKNTLTRISLYIDDMRLLKNIINEFNVYMNIVAFDDLLLDADKLLALIVLKNTFPREFDLLQEDRGFVYQILKNVDEYRLSVREQLNDKNEKISKEIDEFNQDINTGKIKLISEMIPANVALRNSEVKTWAEILTDWEANRNVSRNIGYGGGYSNSMNYDGFIDQFILNNEKNKERLSLFDDSGHQKEIQKRKKIIEENKSKAEEVLVSPIRDLMMIMSSVDIQNLFTKEENALTKNHYFPLIKYLIMEGLLDETYWHYKGYFHKGSLGKNDTVFIKNLLEGVEQDILLDLENPEEVINRLNEVDYRRFNILNKRLLEELLSNDRIKEIQIIIDALDTHNLYSTMISILDSIDYELSKLFVFTVFDRNEDVLSNLIDEIGNEYSNVFRDVLLSLYTRQNPPIDKLSKFNSYIEVNENIIAEVKDTDLEGFFKDIYEADVKFQNLAESNADKFMLENISQINAYRLNVDNVGFLLNSLLDKKVGYGEWISTIFNDKKLISIKKYIKESFKEFIEEYVRSKPAGSKFANHETETLLILESAVNHVSKLGYLKHNQTVIGDTSDLLTTEDAPLIMPFLFQTNKVLFTPNNLNKYWNSIDEYPEAFVEYINTKSTKENAADVLKDCPEICGALVKNSKISDNAFEIMHKLVDSPIDNLGEDISEERVLKILSRDLVSLNEENLNLLLSSQYLEAIVLLANQSVYEEFTSLIIASPKLLELIDTSIIKALIYSEIDEAEIIKVIKSAGKEVAVKDVPNNKTEIMEFILSNGLTSEDINFIALHFTEFPLKDELISIMTSEGLFDELREDSLERNFMVSVLSSDVVTLDIKIDLIVRIIRSCKDVNILVEYIELVDEIQDLSSAFGRKRPPLDSSYKTAISEALHEAGYTNRAEGDRLIIKQEYLLKSTDNKR